MQAAGAYMSSNVLDTYLDTRCIMTPSHDDAAELANNEGEMLVLRLSRGLDMCREDRAVARGGTRDNDDSRR
jgi:hypothetical protein